MIKIIVDAKKQKLPLFSRGSGKTNLQMNLFLVWIKSYIIGKPVKFEYGFQEINVNKFNNKKINNIKFKEGRN